MATFFSPTALNIPYGPEYAEYTLHGFLAGPTTTATNLYVDSSGTIAGQVITLDDQGYLSTSGTRHALWLDDAVAYYLEMRDTAGNVVWSENNVSIQAVDPFYRFVADTGAANAYVMTLSPPITAYSEGTAYITKILTTNTTTSTLNINSLGAFPIHYTGAVLTGGELIAGDFAVFFWNATNSTFQLAATQRFIVGDNELKAIAALTAAANRIPYFTSASAAALLTLSTDTALASANDTTLYSGLALKTYIDSGISAGVTAEAVQDLMDDALTGGAQTLITVTYDDASNNFDFEVTDTLSSFTNDAGFITSTLTTEQVQDIVGAMFTSNTETRCTVTYEDGDGTIDVVVDANLSSYTMDAAFIEAVQDLAGAMVSGGTETGISVTYDDANARFNFVVQGLTTTQFTSANVSQWTNDAGYITATLTSEQVQDIVGAMFTGNTETGVTVTYQDGDGTVDLVVSADLASQVTGTLPEVNGGTGTTALNTIEITQFNVTASTSAASGTPADGALWIQHEA